MGLHDWVEVCVLRGFVRWGCYGAGKGYIAALDNRGTMGSAAVFESVVILRRCRRALHFCTQKW